ncbi:MAG: NifU family protein [Lentisphaeria bacterium]|nr:NifU family protein [Lentisphaeria bacterium]
MNALEINLEFTPNPDALKYTLNRRVLITGSEYFKDLEEAKDHSPLAVKLFSIPGIQTVMIGTNFISVIQDNSQNLRQLNQKLMDAIREHIESGQEICTPRSYDATGLDDMSLAIQNILDAEVRPMVAQDGGDITFVRYDDGIVYVSMQGACQGCPSSSMTLKAGILTRLQQEFPEIIDVEPIG